MTYGEKINSLITDFETIEVRLAALLDKSGELSKPKFDRVLRIINALIQELNSVALMLIHENLY